MVNKFGQENCSVSDIDLQLGDLDLAGRRIYVDIFGEKLTYDMYLIAMVDNSSHFIAFQDAKDESGSDSEEGIKTIEIINKTINLK